MAPSLGILLVALAVPAPTQGPPTAGEAARAWPRLIEARRCGEARALCDGFLAATNRLVRAEGHKCLANVETCQAVSPQSIERGVRHLEAALALVPEDLSVHQGRLHLLHLAGRHADMATALEQSIGLYQAPDPLSPWLAYPAALFQEGKYEQAVTLWRILARRWPDDHRILGSLAGGLAMLKRDAEALEAAQRAVQLAPDDPIDAWNLARIYDHGGKDALADAAYARALALDRDPASRRSKLCLVARFLETKRRSPLRAAALGREAAVPRTRRRR